MARLIGSRLGLLQGRWSGDLSHIDLDHLYDFYEIGFMQGRDDAPFRVSAALTMTCLVELRRMIRRDGAEMMLVVIPSDVQLVDSAREKTLERLRLSPGDVGTLEPWTVNAVLEEFCTDQAMGCLDLRHRFSAQDSPASLYLSATSDNRHLSAAGHQLAGEEIAHFVQSQSEHLSDPAVDDYVRAATLAQAGQTMEAVSVLEPVVSKPLSWSAGYRLYADLLQDLGRHGEAREFYLLARQLEPDSAETVVALGDAELALGRTEAALAQYQSALHLRSRDVVIGERLIHLYNSLGRQEEARAESTGLSHFLATLENQERFADLQKIAEACYDAGVGATDTSLAAGYFHRTLGVYERLLDRAPDRAALLVGQGRAYVATQGYQEETQVFERAIHIDSTLVEGHHNLAETLRALGDYARAAQLDPGADRYFRLGNTLGLNGDLERALEACRLEPDQTDYAYNLAVALATLGNRALRSGERVGAMARWAEARQILGQVVSADPDHRYAASTLLQLEAATSGTDLSDSEQ